MPDTTDSRASTPRSPFAKNRDLYLSCACTVIEGLFGGANFALIWLVMRQVFSGALDPAPLFQISAVLVAVFAARLAIYRFGYVRGQTGGARVSHDLRISLGDSIKRIPLSRFSEHTGGEYLQVLTANVNDYEQILTHRTGDIVRNAALAATVCAFTCWLYPPAGAAMGCSFLLLAPTVALSWRQVGIYGPRRDAVRSNNSAAIMEHVEGMQTLRAYGAAGLHNEGIVESMRAFSRTSYVYERAVIPVGAAWSILAGLIQPLLVWMCHGAWTAGAIPVESFLLICMLPLFTLKLGSALFIDLTAYRNLRIAKRNVAGVLAEPKETGSFGDVPMQGADIELAHVTFAYEDLSLIHI